MGERMGEERGIFEWLGALGANGDSDGDEMAYIPMGYWRRRKGNRFSGLARIGHAPATSDYYRTHTERCDNSIMRMSAQHAPM